jgi:hypothetical protein
MLVDPAVWLSLVGKLATARKVDIGTLATSDYLQSNEPDTCTPYCQSNLYLAPCQEVLPLKQTPIPYSEGMASGFGPLSPVSIFSQPWRRG